MAQNQVNFHAFKQQGDFLLSPKRIKGAFAGKRCINPQSKVLTRDGIKSFGDISDKDAVLSFDQRAKQYRFSQSGSSFPKTKETGYRVIHDRGEFVSSGKHRLLCSSGEYRSVQDIAFSFQNGYAEQVETLTSPSHSIEELDQLLLPLNVQHLIHRPLGSLGRYEKYNRQYGQQLLSVLKTYPMQFLQKFYVQILNLFDAYLGSPSYAGGSCHKILKYNRLYPFFYQNATQDAEALLDNQTFYVFQRPSSEHIFSQLHRSFQVFDRQLSKSYASNKVQEFDQEFLEKTEKDGQVFSCKSNILAIEAVSTPQWFWDIEIPGDNNYVSEGAIHHNSGKTEVGAIQMIKYLEEKPNWTPNGIDPFLALIIAPTHEMMRTLSMKKFLAYAKPFIAKSNETRSEYKWHDSDKIPGGVEIYGMSADNPARVEGKKANIIWLDEIFNMSEQMYLEARARIADSKGYLVCTGSLGVQYVNPKAHWAYKYFKESPDENTQCFEWATSDNVYFPRDELESLKNTLDPRTYRQMFEIDWDTTPLNAVYSDFDEGNTIKGYVYNPNLKTYISIDWGFAHPAAVLFFQYDQARDIVYLFDEIVASGMTLEKMWNLIKSKPYKIDGWCCDIAGNQEREQTAISNIRWFREKCNVTFKYGRFTILNGIALVRSYIKNGLGQSKFVVDEARCPKSLDSIKNYHFKIKNGMILNENPEKLDDDPCDSIRYAFENFIKERKALKIQIG